jgi:hypothetical protein
VEVVLVILKYVEDTLDGGVSLERHVELAKTFVCRRLFGNEQQRLHIPKIVARARCIFLNYM